MMAIIKLVMEKDMYPVIVFAFSKAECERSALALSKLNFNTDEEDALLDHPVQLSDPYRPLPRLVPFRILSDRSRLMIRNTKHGARG
jgi:ATP-dependent RNA helicase DOB1